MRCRIGEGASRDTQQFDLQERLIASENTFTNRFGVYACEESLQASKPRYVQELSYFTDITVKKEARMIQKHTQEGKAACYDQFFFVMNFFIFGNT